MEATDPIDDGADEPEWTVAGLADPARDAEDCPNVTTLRRLIREHHTTWIGTRRDGRPVDAKNVIPFVEERFCLDFTDFTWAAFQHSVNEEHVIILALEDFLRVHQLHEGSPEKYMLMQVARLVYNVHAFLTNMSTVLTNSDPENTMKCVLPQNLQTDMAYSADMASIIEHDESKNTNFQNAFIYLMRILSGEGYRRAKGKFFKRIVDVMGSKTLAFKEHVTVEEFVQAHTGYTVNYKLWHWTTNPSGNYSHLIDYLKERPLADAPDLKEDFNLRSYAGDAVGRGAGVYDCKADMFYPYLERAVWPVLAEKATLVRGRHQRGYRCVAPIDSQVCVIHLACPFPYDIASELEDLADAPLGRRWREAEHFECAHARDELKHDALAAHLAEALSVEASLGAPVVGRGWQVAPPGADLTEWIERDDPDLIDWLSHHGTHIVRLTDPSGLRWCRIGSTRPEGANERGNDALRAVLSCRASSAGARNGDVVLTTREWLECKLAPPKTDDVVLVEGVYFAPQRHCLLDALPPFEASTFVRLQVRDIAVTYIPLVTPPTLPRAVLPSATFREFGLAGIALHGRLFVRHDVDGVTRYFRLDTGRTWEECQCPEVDTIYLCQKFCKHDRFMLYALKGRTLFAVGELDNFEITVLFDGIGGCGKTTLQKAQQSFDPPHLLGIQSPNMQPQFGMSTVAHARVVYCNEVSVDLNVVQEEWQTGVSGEWGSYAVKFGDPIVLEWKAQFFWCGNGFPVKFKNQMGQASRRIGGVLMPYPVAPRDGSIMGRIKKNLGHLQRKEVLAYFEFIAIHGSTDPMSTPERLPPAFAEYYRRSRRATDPVEDFLSEGTFIQKDTDSIMLMSDFKELYNAYRAHFDMGRATRWSEESYRTPFNERGIFVRRKERITIDGIEHSNVDVVYGLRPAARDS